MTISAHNFYCIFFIFENGCFDINARFYFGIRLSLRTKKKREEELHTLSETGFFNVLPERLKRFAEKRENGREVMAGIFEK